MLPFVNMSGDAEQEYFSDGISEDLITDLSKISGLFVLARNSTFAYKGKPIDVRELSRRLNVRYVLEGSVRKAGARIRITAQLIDGENGGHVWAERFDRELTDIFAVQDEITRNIVDALKVRLLPAERQALADQPTTNVEAYQLYLQGRQFFHRHDKRSYGVARRLFERACAIDPQFARALAAIADCDAFLYLHSVSGVSPSEILAISARALALQPDLPEAHASRGLAFYVHGRFAEAEHEFETALRLDPNLFETWYFYGRAKFVEGDMAKAAELLARAAEFSPTTSRRFACCTTSIAASIGRPTAVPRRRRRCAGRSGSWSGIPTMRARPISVPPCSPRSARRSGRASGSSHALSIEPDDFLVLYNAACTYAQRRHVAASTTSRVASAGNEGVGKMRRQLATVVWCGPRLRPRVRRGGDGRASSARARARSTSSPGPATSSAARPTRPTTGSPASRRRPAARSTSRPPAPRTRWWR